MNEEIREKEENMFELSGKNYNLELRVEAKEGEKNERVNNLNEDWASKYESMVDEFEQRLELVDKEKTYFKGRLEEKEEELRKCLADLKNSEIEDSNLKKMLEEKIKRLED